MTMIAGHDRDEARDEAAQPRAQADVDEAFHHDLAGERAGERRVLARAEQRHREQRARHRRAEKRREELVGVADVGHVLVAGAVERGGGHHEDRGVDEEGRHERDRRVDGREADRFALALEGVGDTCASGRWTSAGTGCAASRWRRGCRWRCRASPCWRGSAPSG